MHALASRALLAALCPLLFGGCSGDGTGLDQNGEPQRNNVASDTFSTIQSTIFTPICTACHSGAGAPIGLRLDAQSSYDMLVGVPSGQVPNIARVQPGDPDASYLIQKLIGAAAVGDRMPQGGPYLSQANVDLIRQWIASGAPRPAIASGLVKSLGLKVIDSSMSNARLLVVAFDRDVDATLLNASTVQLMRGDNAVPATLKVPLNNPRVLLITPIAPLAVGNYTLTLRGSGGGAMAGVDARVLNGDINNEGADSMIIFDVENQE